MKTGFALLVTIFVVLAVGIAVSEGLADSLFSVRNAFGYFALALFALLVFAALAALVKKIALALGPSQH